MATTSEKVPHAGRPAWKPGKSVLLRNLSQEHILLELPAGLMRLDVGRPHRFTTDVLDLEQVQQLLSEGKITAEAEKK